MNPHPLSDTSFFENLMVFEKQLLNGNYTNATLFQIASIYTSLVQYYEGLKDPISKYFAEKVDLLFGSKMAEEVVNSQTLSEVKMDSIRDITQDLNLDTKKELRNKMVYFNNKIKQENNAEKSKLLREIIETHQDKYQKIKEYIKDEISAQDNKILEILNQRREKKQKPLLNIEQLYQHSPQDSASPKETFK